MGSLLVSKCLRNVVTMKFRNLGYATFHELHAHMFFISKSLLAKIFHKDNIGEKDDFFPSMVLCQFQSASEMSLR